MKIGLVDIDGHAKKKKRGATIYPNLALCKIARYHKQQGDIRHHEQLTKRDIPRRDASLFYTQTIYDRRTRLLEEKSAVPLGHP